MVKNGRNARLSYRGDKAFRQWFQLFTTQALTVYFFSKDSIVKVYRHSGFIIHCCQTSHIIRNSFWVVLDAKVVWVIPGGGNCEVSLVVHVEHMLPMSWLNLHSLTSPVHSNIILSLLAFRITDIRMQATLLLHISRRTKQFVSNPSK